ncbi:MAG: hypothetical protein WBE29_02760 [Pseudolabrys sp.]
MPILDPERQSRRLQLVDEHVRLENQHDLDGIMTTFGAAPRYDDEPWDAHYAGRDGVRLFYSELLRAMPDLQIDVQRRHIGEATIFWKLLFADSIWARGVACPRPAVTFDFHSAASTLLMKTTDWKARRSTMTAPPCSASSASFMNRPASGVASMPL